MSRRKKKHSVYDEPHLSAGGQADPSEEKAQRRLEREASRPDDGRYSAESVWDEPDILPGREAEVVEQDWSCSSCGYNLRGLTVGHPCPECGRIELYRPAPKDRPGYAAWFARKLAATSPATGWWVAMLGAIVGGIVAIFGAYLENTSSTLIAGMLMVVIVVGPTIEEMMKIAVAVMVVELRPYWFRRVEQILVATIGAAAVFAVVENLFYLFVVTSHPPMGLIVWRWTVCMTLHIGCTTISSRGVVAVWRRSVDEKRPPQIGDGFAMLVTAIAIHGAYNAAMVGLEYAGNPFW